MHFKKMHNHTELNLYLNYVQWAYCIAWSGSGFLYLQIFSNFQGRSKCISYLHQQQLTSGQLDSCTSDESVWFTVQAPATKTSCCPVLWAEWVPSSGSHISQGGRWGLGPDRSRKIVSIPCLFHIFLPTSSPSFSEKRERHGFLKC